MGTRWDARTYDTTSEPQQMWASEVLARLEDIAPDATVMDVGCGTGRVTEELLALVPRGLGLPSQTLRGSAAPPITRGRGGPRRRARSRRARSGWRAAPVRHRVPPG